MFPENARNLDWAYKLKTEGKQIIFISNSFFSKKTKYKDINYVSKLIKKERINIIHTHFVTYNYSLLLLKYLFHPKVKIIGHFHSLFLPPENKYRKIKVLLTSLTFDLILGVSQAVAESVNIAGIKSEKIKSLPNAIDFDRLNESAPFEISQNPEQKVVMMIGWPFHTKGADVAIEAVKKLNEERSEVLLAIILSGGNEVFTNDIIRQLGKMPSWIKILEPRDDIATYLNGADIFLSASREEGFSYTLVEAAYCRPLLVSSDIPAPVSLRIPHFYIYRVEHAEELKELLKRMFNITKEQKDLYKEEQKDYVKTTYDLKRWAEKLAGYYKLYRLPEKPD
jgi:glycosyltransferase involved in cell wall biosynthesis